MLFCKTFFTFTVVGLKDCRAGFHGLFTPLIDLAERGVGVKLNLYSLFCAHCSLKMADLEPSEIRRDGIRLVR